MQPGSAAPTAKTHTTTAPAVAPQGNKALAAIHGLVAHDFAAVNLLIPNRLTSDVDLVAEISNYIVTSGGKRLRPLLVLLGARALGYEGERHIKLATVIEFLHTATLLHDDVVDRSDLRRGRRTANALWGNAPSVLVGDFLYSRAFQLMTELDAPPIINILANATNVIAEGEVAQLAHIGDIDLSETSYFKVIRAKTAMLFEAAAHTAGVLAATDAGQIEALRQYGEAFGLAYQLVDDWLDYAGDPAAMGKNTGDDLAEGKLTLPLIRALQCASDGDTARLKAAIGARSSDGLTDVVALVQRSGALDYTKSRAADYAARAAGVTAGLPRSRYRDALVDLCEICVARLS
jgi:octaprenyl-diphosphate synthase